MSPVFLRCWYTVSCVERRETCFFRGRTKGFQPPSTRQQSKVSSLIDELSLGTSSGLLGNRYLIPKTLELDYNI